MRSVAMGQGHASRRLADGEHVISAGEQIPYLNDAAAMERHVAHQGAATCDAHDFGDGERCGGIVEIEGRIDYLDSRDVESRCSIAVGLAGCDAGNCLFEALLLGAELHAEQRSERGSDDPVGACDVDPRDIRIHVFKPGIDGFGEPIAATDQDDVRGAQFLQSFGRAFAELGALRQQDVAAQRCCEGGGNANVRRVPAISENDRFSQIYVGHECAERSAVYPVGTTEALDGHSLSGRFELALDVGCERGGAAHQDDPRRRQAPQRIDCGIAERIALREQDAAVQRCGERRGSAHIRRRPAVCDHHGPPCGYCRFRQSGSSRGVDAVVA